MEFAVLAIIGLGILLLHMHSMPAAMKQGFAVALMVVLLVFIVLWSMGIGLTGG